MTWRTFTAAEYIRSGGWQGLPGQRPESFEALAAQADSVEGEAHRILCFDGPLWSLELMVGPDGKLTGDQLQIAPELSNLDPQDDSEAIRARLPFAYLTDVERASHIAGVEIEAIYGDDPREDESVVFLANGVNLHFQPAGDVALLRLITNHDGRAGRDLVRRLHARRR